MFAATSFASWQDVLTFDEAVQRHGMLKDALNSLTKVQGMKKDAALAIIKLVQDGWNEAIGAGDPDSAMASALRGVVPLDYVPLLRMRSGIPAAYLMVRLVESLIAQHNFGADLADDYVLRQAAKDAFAKFEWKRQNAEKLAEGFGFDRSDAWAQMRKVEDRSGQVNDLMMRVAELAGRMFKAFRYQAIPSRTDEPQEVEGVTVGGDLDRMLDDEAASMGIDPEVMARVAEDRAHQYKMAGESTKNRGPLVVTIDESGSMHGPREVWAKACAVALARVALAEGRKVRVVHFSTGTDVHDVRKGNADDMRLVAESHVSGGTDIDTAMRVSLNQVGNLAKDDHEGADIVFITDGLDGYSKEPFDRMVAQGVQLWTVAIDIDIKAVAEANRKGRGAGYGASGWLYDYARAYVHLDQSSVAKAGDQAIAAAVQLRDSAMDNGHRGER